MASLKIKMNEIRTQIDSLNQKKQPVKNNSGASFKAHCRKEKMRKEARNLIGKFKISSIIAQDSKE